MKIAVKEMHRGQAIRMKWACLLLALVTVLTYWPVHHYDFINLDDHQYVYENDIVRQGLKWAGVVWASTAVAVSNWHPLTWLSHMLDCQLFGLDAGDHHLVNVFFHTANAVLLLVVLTRLTGSLGRSALVAGLFALHPLHIESVAWISERKDVLSTLFGLLTIGAYQRYTTRLERKWYGLALLFFALGLMSKPMVVTLPFVLLLLDYWPLRRWPQPVIPATTAEVVAGASPPTSADHADHPPRRGTTWRTLVLEKWPFFALTAVCCVITFLVQKETAVVSVDRISIRVRVLNMLVSYAAYAGKLVWPTNLSVFYPYPTAWPAVKVVTSALFLLGVSLAVTVRRRSAPYLFVGWCWFVGTLVPVIGLVQVGDQAMADRYTYLPSIGFFVMLVWLGGQAVTRVCWGRRAGWIAAAVVLGACAVATSWNLRFWRNSATLFNHALEVTTKNFVAHFNLGLHWARLDDYDQAVRHYTQALHIRPSSPQVHFSLGILLAKHNQTKTALAAYREAISLDPNYVDARLNLGNLLLKLGQIADAEAEFRTVLRQQPSNAEAHTCLGNALAKGGKRNEAVEQYAEAVRMQPEYAEAHLCFGMILAEQGQIQEALAHFARAIKLDPGDPRSYNEMGAALASQSRIPEAVECYDRALRLRPDYAEAHLNLGIVWLMLGRLDQAIAHYQRAIQLKPEDARAYNNLGYALGKQGQNKPAEEAYAKALEFQPDLIPALNGLAWLLATAREPDLRDGPRALRLAERACTLTERREPIFLKTLAAALAANGRFEEAAATARKALSLAEQRGQNRVAADLKDQLQRYESRQPLQTPR